VGGFLLAVGSRYVRGTITLVIEDVLERYSEGKRRQSGGEIPALQIHNLDFFYGTQQVLFDVTSRWPRVRSWPCWGPTAPGKEHTAAAVSGLDPSPPRRHPHLRRQLHISRAGADHRPARRLLVGGKMTFPGLTVSENLRVGEYCSDARRRGRKVAFDEAIDSSPSSRPVSTSRAGTLSGGEQQMLALARVMDDHPAPAHDRRAGPGAGPPHGRASHGHRAPGQRRRGHRHLVEQSVNRAMSLARHAFFIERGEVRFDVSHGRAPRPRMTCCGRSSCRRHSERGLRVSRVGSVTAPVGRSRGLPSSVSTTGCWRWGLVLIYRTSRVVNFAQGQIGVVAAVFLVKLYYDFGFNYWVAPRHLVALAAPWAPCPSSSLRRLFNRPRVMVMVATIGLSQVLFLFTVFPFIRPKKLYRAFPVPISWTFHVGTFLFSPGEVLTLIVAPVVVIALAAFIRFSSWGLAMRAMAENAESARLSGCGCAGPRPWPGPWPAPCRPSPPCWRRPARPVR